MRVTYVIFISLILKSVVSLDEKRSISDFISKLSKKAEFETNSVGDVRRLQDAAFLHELNPNMSNTTDPTKNSTPKTINQTINDLSVDDKELTLLQYAAFLREKNQNVSKTVPGENSTPSSENDISTLGTNDHYVEPFSSSHVNETLPEFRHINGSTTQDNKHNSEFTTSSNVNQTLELRYGKGSSGHQSRYKPSGGIMDFLRGERTEKPKEHYDEFLNSSFINKTVADLRKSGAKDLPTRYKTSGSIVEIIMGKTTEDVKELRHYQYAAFLREKNQNMSKTVPGENSTPSSENDISTLDLGDNEMISEPRNSETYGNGLTTYPNRRRTLDNYPYSQTKVMEEDHQTTCKSGNDRCPVNELIDILPNQRYYVP